MKLYSGPLSMFGAKAEIALREKGRLFELELVAFDRERGYHPKHPEVLRVNPKRQVPVLIDASVEIFDSTQIFEYLEHRWPEPPLWPRGPAERAKARALEHCSDEVFFPNVIRLMGLRADPDPTDAPEWIKSRTAIQSYYAQTELGLEGQSYLAGDYSYADIAFYMAQFFAARHTVPIGAEHTRLLSWRKRVAERPAVRLVIEAMAAYLHSVGLPVPDFA
jgi:glutathione S-transferase